MFGSIDAAGVTFSNGAFTAQRHSTKIVMYMWWSPKLVNFPPLKPIDTLWSNIHTATGK